MPAELQNEILTHKIPNTSAVKCLPFQRLGPLTKGRNNSRRLCRAFKNYKLGFSVFSLKKEYSVGRFFAFRKIIDYSIPCNIRQGLGTNTADFALAYAERFSRKFSSACLFYFNLAKLDNALFNFKIAVIAYKLPGEINEHPAKNGTKSKEWNYSCKIAQCKKQSNKKNVGANQKKL